MNSLDLYFWECLYFAFTFEGLVLLDIEFLVDRIMGIVGDLSSVSGVCVQPCTNHSLPDPRGIWELITTHHGCLIPQIPLVNVWVVCWSVVCPK